ncbi:MAG: toll/interleukin-1 receptor domain-containing protein [Streptosporangiaceae bacterium]|nr:toll/interleukin-1 receptor domain-containing protein [Streptosporangiaceae bacterium]
MMKVFISWSGDRSKAVAEKLRDWLPTIVQSVEPFVSTQDVPVGGRGLNVLASQLQECSFGILCLTQENKQGPWIHFEAGALSKVIDASRVVPLLLDLKVSDLTGPLVQFQVASIEDRDGIFSLIKALAEESSPPIAESRLQRLFDAFWPELEAKVSQLKTAVASKPKQDTRSERDSRGNSAPEP